MVIRKLAKSHWIFVYAPYVVTEESKDVVTKDWKVEYSRSYKNDREAMSYARWSKGILEVQELW